MVDDIIVRYASSYVFGIVCPSSSTLLFFDIHVHKYCIRAKVMGSLHIVVPTFVNHQDVCFIIFFLEGMCVMSTAYTSLLPLSQWVFLSHQAFLLRRVGWTRAVGRRRRRRKREKTSVTLRA